MGCRSNLISYLGLSENGDILIVKNHMFRHVQTTLMRFLHTSQHSDVLHCAESWNIHRSRDWNRAKTVTSNHADHEPGSDLDLLKLWPIPHVFHMGFQSTKAPGHGGSRPCAKLIKAQLSRSPGAVPCFNGANWLQIIHLHPFSCFFPMKETIPIYPILSTWRIEKKNASFREISGRSTSYKLTIGGISLLLRPSTWVKQLMMKLAAKTWCYGLNVEALVLIVSQKKLGFHPWSQLNQPPF